MAGRLQNVNPGESDRVERFDPRGSGIALPAGSTRTARAVGAITEWTTRPGFAALLDLFGADSSGVDSRDLLDHVEQTSAVTLGGDRPDGLGAVVGHADGGLTGVVALEDLGDFCWNFRRGTPRAVLHLFHELVTGIPPDPARLPTIADPVAWSEPAATSLRYLYLDHQLEAFTERPDLIPTLLREEISSYPELRPSPYRERSEAGGLPFSRDLGAVFQDAADDLGLVRRSLPCRTSYDHVAILGGGFATPRLRADFAADLVRVNGLSTSAVWLLGSPRPIERQAERQRTESYAPGAIDEFDLMAAAGERAFQRERFHERALCGCTDLTTPCPEWHRRWANLDEGVRTSTPPALQHNRQRTYPGPGFELHVLSAATGQAPARPNTADTYHLLSQVAHLDESQRVLIVTDQVFVPFQYFDALRLLYLPTGAEIEAVGFEEGDRPDTAAYRLQEILSGLRSARRLAVAAVAR